MKFIDYYQELEVIPTASNYMIKHAYRALARLYHPDVNPGNKEAEERFKIITEAYRILSNPDSRAQYDELRNQYYYRVGAGYTYSMIEEMEQIEQWQSVVDNVRGDLFNNFFDAFFGVEEKAPRQAPRPGDDLEVTLSVTLEEAFHGSRRRVKVGDGAVTIDVPPGVRQGSELVVRGKGSPGAMGTPPGDLYIIIETQPHSQFYREGDHLYLDMLVDIYTAAVGGEIQVPTLDGEVPLAIPPRTQAGASFCLQRCGMPNINEPTKRGNLYVEVTLVFPEALTDSELNILRKLAAARQ
jgi:curved DNA-binding protein